MEPEIISRESIKPSSATPLHLKTHKLCLLDQYRHHAYFPIVLYYPFNQEPNISDPTQINHIVSERLQLLKQSLPETLSRFYPFAGKIKDNLSVDCNDEGIYFVEARVKSSLSDYFNQPNFANANYKFIPFDVKELSGSISGLHVAKIQVTTFAYGGLVICACLSHLFGDGITLNSFLKSWVATACKNAEEAERPNNDASSLFPQQEIYPKEATWTEMCKPFYRDGRFVSRRFLFDAKAIANLKDKVASSLVQNPSRVEAVSALLSRCIMTAFKGKFGSHRPILLTHTVNMRRKAKPLMPEYSMGNIVWTANALCTNEEPELDGLVGKLREAIMEINGDFLKSLQGDEGFLNLCEAAKNESALCSSAVERITFSSWCNFGLVDIDFGWGKPIWVSTIGIDGPVPCFSNTIILMDTRLKGEIEAWVYLLEEDMNILELDKELIAFAKMDPSPM
ncbi:vinorine synthase-like [Melia azedarach]|uniref:Epi-neemfruitin B 7-O-acetyltransferse L7AT n=2 Tax=Melia azedarach TaxID=155640 RepID=L7AT_MELAZ|nr:vinorine synthase-like [Melia azedarach]WBW48726.1 L7AT [Melia azedarach]